ncbi:hypothetical protein B5M09_007563, partial [Aphanomyces astaci]
DQLRESSCQLSNLVRSIAPIVVHLAMLMSKTPLPGTTRTSRPYDHPQPLLPRGDRGRGQGEQKVACGHCLACGVASVGVSTYTSGTTPRHTLVKPIQDPANLVSITSAVMSKGPNVKFP